MLKINLKISIFYIYRFKNSYFLVKKYNYLNEGLKNLFFCNRFILSFIYKFRNSMFKWIECFRILYLNAFHAYFRVKGTRKS